MTGFPLFCSPVRVVVRSLLTLHVYLEHQELLPKEAVEYSVWQVYWLQQFLVSGLNKGNMNLYQTVSEISMSIYIQQSGNLLSTCIHSNIGHSERPLVKIPVRYDGV